MIIAACLNYLGINKIWRILRFGVILLAMIVILRSQSRGQMIAAVIAIALGIMLSHGIHRLKKVLVAVGSISIIAVVLIWTFLTYGETTDRWSLVLVQRNVEFGGFRVS